MLVWLLQRASRLDLPLQLAEEREEGRERVSPVKHAEESSELEDACYSGKGMSNASSAASASLKVSCLSSTYHGL